MQEPITEKKGNIYVCEEPYLTNLIDWGNKHDNTLVAIEFESEGSLAGHIHAYCDKKYGIELHEMYKGNATISIALATAINVDNILGGAYALVED